jgi:hypothetical protein
MRHEPGRRSRGTENPQARAVRRVHLALRDLDKQMHREGFSEESRKRAVSSALIEAIGVAVETGILDPDGEPYARKEGRETV